MEKKMSRIHYLDYRPRLSNPIVLCKDRPQNYEDVGKHGKENWQEINGTRKPSKVTCKECLKILKERPSGFHLKRWWHRWRTPPKDFCKSYGHSYDSPESFSGTVIAKGAYVNRSVFRCVHCHHSYYKDEKRSDVDTSKWGYSFGSEGVCSHCSKSQTCFRSLMRKLPDGMQFACVYLQCPINEFEPYDKKSWEKEIAGLGDLMR